MDNPTDTNQASEVKRNSPNKSDEDVKLDSILRNYIGNYVTADEYERHVTEAKTAIKALIRTEKIKLLAEVRERVVQGLPDTDFLGISIRVKDNIRDGGYHDGVLYSRLATEETLTKLEAEL